ncbi:energy transducer TonB, partial [Marinobacter sp. F3R08]|nr:energy transducer TonB [Marinobacter sp. F3R08]
MTRHHTLSRLVLLILACAITLGALVVAAPEETVTFNTLGESAINTAPAIRITLAEKTTPEPEEAVQQPEPQPSAEQQPEPEPEP